MWGAIAVATADSERLSGDVLDQLASFAELLEIALVNMHAWSALTELAAADSLTGLPNRRTFQLALHREIGRAQRQAAPLSVVVIDVDHFKSVNDTFGHLVGDTVLTEIANRLKVVTRSSEMVARTGGEEFIWLLPDTDSRGAAVAAERALAAIGNRPFPGVGRVTVSVGVCGSDLVANLDTIVEAADRALYSAKRSGRNCSVTYTPLQ